MEKIIKQLLDDLEKAYEQERKPVKPIYPYDKETNTIQLPKKFENELRRLVRDGKKVEAIKRVTQLTGAGLRVSKDYVDG